MEDYQNKPTDRDKYIWLNANLLELRWWPDLKMHISNGIENGYSAASIPRKSPSGKRSKRGMKIIDSEVEKHLLYGKETTLWNLHTPATQNCE